MFGQAIVSKKVRFDTGFSCQILFEKLLEVKDLYPGDYVYWASRCWDDGHEQFRLGLRQLPVTDISPYVPLSGRAFTPGEGLTLSMDVLILPNDGKELEWFTTTDFIRSFTVRSRVCVDDLSQPLRDLTRDESVLSIMVNKIAYELESRINERLESRLVAH